MSIKPRPCPVCHTAAEKAKLFLEESIDSTALSGFSYASRKEPEYMCHRLVRCPACELIYASHPPEQSELAQAYHIAEYDSAEEANDAAQSYITAIAPVLATLSNKQSALEIGSGTGVFLELLKKVGFTQVVGVEPSSAAIATAPEHRRKWLQEGIFVENVFAPESFDLICCFMTMEHIREPLETTLSAWRLLRPGGIFVTITHDYNSLVNRAMGKKSPIIDIEHMQLFSQKSSVELFSRGGFSQISVTPLPNCYSLNYWLRLAPLPKIIKQTLQRIGVFTGIGKIKISVNVGNMITAGFRPKNN
jgi:SAM-dependent methyltransferase